MKNNRKCFAVITLLIITVVSVMGISVADDTKPIPYGYGTRPDAPIPRPGVMLEKGRFAIVITDPQVDFLSPEGVSWGVVGESVTKNNTVEHLGQLFKLADDLNVPTFVSPHYYYPHDHVWQHEGALEKLMHNISMFDRKGPLNVDNFKGSGADWLEQYKPYINNGKTIVTSPHKVFGPETNDLVMQLRKQDIKQVILAGMSANLCTESHMRELVEQGFEVVVVTDATAAAILPGYDGYEAAFINYRFIASDVWSTDETVQNVKDVLEDPMKITKRSTPNAKRSFK